MHFLSHVIYYIFSSVNCSDNLEVNSTCLVGEYYHEEKAETLPYNDKLFQESTDMDLFEENDLDNDYKSQAMIEQAERYTIEDIVDSYDICFGNKAKFSLEHYELSKQTMDTDISLEVDSNKTFETIEDQKNSFRVPETVSIPLDHSIAGSYQTNPEKFPIVSDNIPQLTYKPCIKQKKDTHRVEIYKDYTIVIPYHEFNTNNQASETYHKKLTIILEQNRMLNIIKLKIDLIYDLKSKEFILNQGNNHLLNKDIENLNKSASKNGFSNAINKNYENKERPLMTTVSNTIEITNYIVTTYKSYKIVFPEYKYNKKLYDNSEIAGNEVITHIRSLQESILEFLKNTVDRIEKNFPEMF